MKTTMHETKNAFSGRSKTMKTIVWVNAIMLSLAFALGGAGCQSTRPDRDYVQANVYQKDVFQGDWFYVRTVVDHDYESYWMGYYGTFTGDQTWSSSLGSIERITWIIDKDFLYAYRTVPIIAGAHDDDQETDFREDPVAAFRITKHFDIMKSYNTLTGEELNVMDENDTERPWYERRYMRVDWSQNLLLGYYWTSLDAFESSGYVTRESVPFYCGEGSDLGYEIEGSCRDGIDNNHDGVCDTDGCKVTYIANGEEKTQDLPPDPVCVADPDASEVRVASVCKPEWLPVVRTTDQSFDDAYGTYFNKEFSEEGLPEGTPYYFSFTTQEMWTPNTEFVWLYMGFGTYPISSVKITVRNAFMRAPEISHYEPLNVVDAMWDHFGIIRMAQEVYMGGEGTTPYEPDNPKCDPASPEYDPLYEGCDPDQIIHQDRGPVDFKNYWGARHNMWVDYKDLEGNVIPPADRQVRHIVYYLNPGFPKWLISTAFEVVEEWNKTFMEAVDLAKTGEMRPDHDCTVEMGGAVPDRPESFSAYDGMIEDPASTPRFTGADCVFILRVNSADLADGQYDDAAGTRTIALGEDGRIDPQRSNVDPNGEQMGDLRFKFFSVIDTPGAGFSGVSLPMQDPRNGELVQSNFNITRDSYEYMMTFVILNLGLYADLCQSDTVDFHDAGVGDTYRSICTYINNEFGAINLHDWISGEHIKEYFANQGKTDRAPTPIVPEALSGMPSPVGGGAWTSAFTRLGLANIQAKAEKLQQLTGPDSRARLFSDRIFKLKGTEFEKMIYDNPESYLLMQKDGIQVPIIDPMGPVTEDMLDGFSAMRKSFTEQRYLQNKRLYNMLRYHFEPANPLVDYAYVELAKQYMEEGYNARQMILNVGQKYFRDVMLHEAGHSIGMEHNFAGSIDRNNYHNEYFEIANIGECASFNCEPGETDAAREAANCWPCPDSAAFQGFELTVDETIAWTEEVRRMEKKRDMLGVRKWQTSSIMDYLPEVYDDFAGLGKFDKAYTLFAYAGKVEAYNGDPKVNRSKYILDPVQSGEELPKVYWTYYVGGNRCDEDADCPYNAGSGRLPQSQLDANVTQKCTAMKFFPEIRYCSSYYEDAQLSIDAGGSGGYFPIMYRFCNDIRTYDISWCNMFDAGGSYREIVENLREFWNNWYPYAHFRNYKRGYSGGAYWFPLEMMGKINQHFYYRYFYETLFLETEGPLGVNDMYSAVSDSLNYFGEVLATPDVGSYKLDPVENTYYKASDELGQGDLDIPFGMGRYMWSSFQDGQLGIFKVERQGSHLDKLLTLWAMMLREWGATYFYDERFWFNFYDLFSNEAMDILAYEILDDPTYTGARLVDGKVFLPTIYSPSSCLDTGTNPSAYWLDCTAAARPDYYPPRPWEVMDASGYPKIANGSNEILRNYALVMSLAELPFFTDPTYERKMFICEKGSGYCFDICEEAGAHYFCSDPEVTPLVPGEDFVEYTSSRLHKTYVAVKVEKWLPMFVDEVDIAMELLRKADALQTLYNDLLDYQAAGTYPPEYPDDASLIEGINHVGSKLVETESFITNVINIQRQYGISSWLI
jgi:hypothetical protein